jgi:bacteriocin-like protein
MKTLTNNELNMVSGGNIFVHTIISLLGEEIFKQAIELAAEKEDLFQDSNMYLPYNRL